MENDLIQWHPMLVSALKEYLKDYEGIHYVNTKVKENLV